MIPCQVRTFSRDRNTTVSPHPQGAQAEVAALNQGVWFHLNIDKPARLGSQKHHVLHDVRDPSLDELVHGAVARPRLPVRSLRRLQHESQEKRERSTGR